jgi:CheY-like chemotaxis protein
MMHKKTVLVADDNAPTRELMNLVLTQSGYFVITAITGLEAVDKARIVRPGLIFIDLSLPGMTGDEAIACLKTYPLTKYIPVIVNTAFYKGSEQVERAIVAGATEIIYKPNNFRALPNIANRYLSSEQTPGCAYNPEFPNVTDQTPSTRIPTNPVHHSCGESRRAVKGQVGTAPISHSRSVEVSLTYEHVSTDTQDTAPRLRQGDFRQLAAL